MSQPIRSSRKASALRAGRGSAMARIFRSCARFCRRRFFFLLSILVLTVVGLVLGVALFFFRPGPVNQLTEYALAEVFDTGRSAVTFDQSRTRVTFPRLNGTGSVDLYDLRVESPTKQYDWLHVPHVRIDYDLLGVAASPIKPVRRVVLPEGMYAVFHIDESGDWVDESSLKESESDPPREGRVALPDVVMRGGVVRFRLPQAMRDPPKELADRVFMGNRFEAAGGGWYLSGIDATLVSDHTNPLSSRLRVTTDCDTWGKVTIAGQLEPSGRVRLRATKRDLKVDAELAGRLKDNVSSFVEMIYGNDGTTANRISVSADLDLLPGELPRLQVQAVYTGSVMYRDLPILATNVGALVEFDGSSLNLVDATARRRSSTISVNGGIDSLGTPNERLTFNIAVDGMVVSPTLLRSLVGERQPEGGLRFPEFERYGRANPVKQPRPIPILDTIYRTLEPSGLISARVSYSEESRTKRNSLSFRLLIPDVSARYVGEMGPLARFAKDATSAPAAVEAGGARSLLRFDGAYPRQVESPSDPFAGFPLPLYDIAGVVSGSKEPGQQGEFRIHGLTGEDVRLLQDTLGIQGLTAEPRGLVANRLAQEQKIFLSATILDNSDPTGMSDDSRLTLTARTEGLKVDEELISLLPWGVRRQLQEFGIEGAADIEQANLTIAPMSGGGDPQLELTFRAKGLKGRYTLPGASEPVMVEQLRATVGFNLGRNEIRVRSVEGRLMDADLRAGGSLMNERILPRTDFSASLSEMPINAALFRRLPPELAALESLFTRNPTGTISVTIDGRTLPSQSTPDTTLQVRLRGATLTHESLSPFTLSGVNADLTVVVRGEGTEVRIHRLEGVPVVPITERVAGISRTYVGPDMQEGKALSKVRAAGGVFIPGAFAADPRIAMDLMLEGKQVLLSTELKEALNRIDGGTEAARSELGVLWDSLEPSDANGKALPIGRVDVNGQLAIRLASKEAGLPVSIDFLFALAMDGGQVTYDAFPLPLTDVSMRATLTPGSVSFSRLSARSGGGEVQIPELSLRDGVLLVSVKARGMSLEDTQFRDALPAQVAKTVDTFNPRGKAGLDVTLRMTQERMEFDAAIELREVALVMGIEFERCEGLISLSGEFGRGVVDPENGEKTPGLVPLLSKGRISFKRAFWKDLEVTDITTSLQYADDRMAMPNIRGRVHGGVFDGGLTVELGSGGTSYSGAIKASGIDLESVATVLAGGESQDGSERLVGGVDAELSFYSDNGEGRIGHGSLDIGKAPLSPEELADLASVPEELRGGRPATLGAVPLFGGLYRELNLGSGEYFDEARIIFWLMNDRILIRQMNLVSDGIRVESVQDNYVLYAPRENGEQLHLVLVPTMFPRTATLPVVQPVLDAVKGVVLRIFVGGTLESPAVRALSNRRLVEQDEEDRGPQRPEPMRTRSG